MKIDAAIETLELNLQVVEHKLNTYFPPTTRSYKEQNKLIEVRNQLVLGLKCIKEGFEMLTIEERIFNKVMKAIK